MASVLASESRGAFVTDQGIRTPGAHVLIEWRVIRSGPRGRRHIACIPANSSPPDSLKHTHDYPVAAGPEEGVGLRDRRTYAPLQIPA